MGPPSESPGSMVIMAAWLLPVPARTVHSSSRAPIFTCFMHGRWSLPVRTEDPGAIAFRQRRTERLVERDAVRPPLEDRDGRRPERDRHHALRRAGRLEVLSHL